MINPLVSVIIPLYNCENYIEATIDSVLQQTWSNIEILIVDDGSTDHSLAIAKKIVSDKIKVFEQVNKGASAARNLGLMHAKGDYIQYLDADDLLSPDKIEKQLIALAGTKDQIAVCPTIYFFNWENHLEKKPEARELTYLYTTTSTLNFLLNLYGVNGNGSMITIHAWLTPKTIINAIGSWNEEISVDDDGEYFCRVVLSAAKIIFTDNVYSYYRKYKNGNNLANRKTLSAIESTYYALTLKEKHLLEHNADPTIKQTFANAYYKLAVDCFPKYKTLSREILIKANQNLITKPKLFLGSSITDFLANHISWKLVKYIQFFKDKLH
jgi:glycosyltransferase involved in cell wall biosynthesis